MLSLLIYLIISHQFLQIHQSLYFFSLYIIFRFKIFSLFPTRLVTLLNKTSYMLFPLNMIKYISCCSLSKDRWPEYHDAMDFNTSHVVVYLTHFRAFYFFISLFALISRHFSDFYQAPRLYYFQCLVLHKSLVFTILFHFSQLSRLVNFLQISFSFLYH